MIIKILEPYPAINRALLTGIVGVNNKFIEYEEDMDPTMIDAVVIRSHVTFNEQMIRTYPNIKYIFRVGVWTDNIDMDLAKRMNVQVLTTPWANTDSVAQLCIWWILSLLRRTYKKFWHIDDRYSFMGQELSWKTIWIVGFGNIGQKLYALINAFGENQFIVYDPFINPKKWTQNNIRFVNDRSVLFQQSDIISFHIPLTPDTKNFLSWKDFSLLRPNVSILNTSRWYIINQDDLIDFLQTHPDSWAFLDTWNSEPDMPDNRLQYLENCIITPHIWAMTYQAHGRMHNFAM